MNFFSKMEPDSAVKATLRVPRGSGTFLSSVGSLTIQKKSFDLHDAYSTENKHQALEFLERCRSGGGGGVAIISAWPS